MENTTTLSTTETNRASFSIIQRIVFILKRMYNIESTLPYLIAIVFTLGLLFLLHHPAFFPAFIGKAAKYQTFAKGICYLLTLYLLYLSSRQSLLIPSILIGVAMFGFGLLRIAPEAHHYFTIEMMQYVMGFGSVLMVRALFGIR